MRRLQTKNAPAAIGPYSQAIVLEAQGLVFTSGQLGLNPDTGVLVQGGIEEQTRQVFRNLQAILAAAGTGLDHLVKTTVYLKNMEDFSRMNTIYGEIIGDLTPARTTIEVSHLPKDALVEIEAVAALDA
jgi:2-iminobutanoate/2-iminopropanoate deaminase